MRWPTVLAVVVATGVAHAKPASNRELLAPAEPSLDRCVSGKSWPKLRTCLQRTGSVTTLYDLDAAKLVTVHARDGSDTSGVHLFLLRDGLWRNANIYITVGPANEVLSFKRLEKTRGYRLDVGSIMTTGASVGEIRTVVTLRRMVTTVCLDDTGYCRTLVSRCDALIDGKTYWSYRGELVMDSNNLRLAGDTSRAGTVCAPAKAFSGPKLEGDPLE